MGTGTGRGIFTFLFTVLPSRLISNTIGHIITCVQWVVAASMMRSSLSSATQEELMWMNLGLWIEGGGGARPSQDKSKDLYGKACRDLALALGKAAGLSKGDEVLCCGCGYGAEILCFHREFSLAKTIGIDSNEDAARVWNERGALRGIEEEDVRLITMRVGEIGAHFSPGSFTHVLALDSAYHFPHKEEWLDQVACLFKERKGCLALTDICLKEPYSPPWWLWAVLRLMGVQTTGVYAGKEAYRAALDNAGFKLSAFMFHLDLWTIE